MNMKVFVQEDWASQSKAMFHRRGFQLVDKPELADIICFNGGEDINPDIYGQKPIPECRVSFNQARDNRELEIYKRSSGKFKFGICRGGQLLNCLNGGSLWQDVDGHHRAHDIVDLKTSKTIWSSSIHHQAFIPGLEAETVAVASASNFRTGIVHGLLMRWARGDGYHESLEDDQEVVFYPKDRALCIQGHPEYSGYSEMTEYCFELLKRYY
jgi:gamma-glutamyl-gamma-aminobutyrate hydrolase PuuD